MYVFIKEGDASNFYLPASDIFLTTRIVWAFGNMNWKNLTKAHFSPTFAPQNAWIEEDLLTTLTTKSESIIQELNWEYSVVYTIRWYLRFLRKNRVLYLILWLSILIIIFHITGFYDLFLWFITKIVIAKDVS